MSVHQFLINNLINHWRALTTRETGLNAKVSIFQQKEQLEAIEGSIQMLKETKPKKSK